MPALLKITFSLPNCFFGCRDHRFAIGGFRDVGLDGDCRRLCRDGLAGFEVQVDGHHRRAFSCEQQRCFPADSAARLR